MIPKIAKSLIGKKIVGVVVRGGLSDYGDRKGDGNSWTDAYAPGGYVYLVFKNGQILSCWNSEWGGVKLLESDNVHDAEEIKFVEKELKNG